MSDSSSSRSRRRRRRPFRKKTGPRPPAVEVERCETCGKPTHICVCADAKAHDTRLRVVILQHPREQDRDLGTAPLLLAGLSRAEKHVGLSWASLSRALGEEANPEAWAVLFPTLPKGASAEGTTAPDAHGAVLVDKRGAPLSSRRLHGLIVLDGSWSQAKTLWWRNPWLLKLGRLAILEPKAPSIYGRLRKEPRREYLSTLEAVAEALVVLGEPEALADDLRRLFRSMVQRARDGAPTAVSTADGELDNADEGADSADDDDQSGSQAPSQG